MKYKHGTYSEFSPSKNKYKTASATQSTKPSESGKKAEKSAKLGACVLGKMVLGNK